MTLPNVWRSKYLRSAAASKRRRRDLTALYKLAEAIDAKKAAQAPKPEPEA